MKKVKFVLSVIFILSSLGTMAQDKIIDDDRFFYEPKAEEDMVIITPADSFSKKGIQHGVILNPVYIYEHNDYGELGAYLLNARIWGKTYLWNNSFFFIRGKNSYISPTVKNEIYSYVEPDNVFDLDLAYLSMNAAENAFKISAGRKFYNIGTGVVLNGRGDGLEMSWMGSVFSIDLLGLYTGLLDKDNNPYGLSDRDIADGSKRTFTGGTAAACFLNQKFYIFGLAQFDHAEEESASKSRYNSQYYGAGLEGIVFSDLSYYGEFIYEKGRSYIKEKNDKSSIAAYAANSGIIYFLPVVLNPAVILQYAFGSGDNSRTDYTNSVRPATSSGDDTGFISFGTFSGGYALRPKLSNIHIIRAGLSVIPFSWVDSVYLKEMSLSGKYSYYIKDKKSSYINNGSHGEQPGSFLGQGIDVALKWQIFYEMSLYVNYGMFIPGDAYSASENPKHFIMTGFNFNF